MTKLKKFKMEGGMAFRLRSTPSFGEGFSVGGMGLPFNLRVIRRPHNDRLKQVRKRKVKLKRLMRNIPREGARAKEILGARKK
jgi:hypothetical protein